MSAQTIASGSPTNTQEPQGFLDRYFQLTAHGTNVRQEVLAGLTTFLAMVYSVAVVPGMLSAAGFPYGAVFVAVCIVAAAGSLLMGFWANLPMAIGCAISLTAFTAFSLVLGQGVSIGVSLSAIFLMGIVFTGITVTGVRQWILNNLPAGIAHGTGVGIGLFLLLIAANSVGLVAGGGALHVHLGEFTSLPVLASLVGLAAIFGLERRAVPGSILLVIVALTVFGLIFDENVSYSGAFSLPTGAGELMGMAIMPENLKSALSGAVLPTVLALVMTAIFDATGTIRALAGQAGLIEDNGQIKNGGRALTVDSASSIVAGLTGGAPAAVYIESAAGTAAGGRTGLTAVVVGVLFVVISFFGPLASIVPAYATAPALMYVGLLMLGNVAKIDMSDFVDGMAGLVCAVFIVLCTNIVTGIMLGFGTLVIGRLISGEWKKLNVGTVLVAIALVAFYAGGWAI